jgi:hypothetical protein
MKDRRNALLQEFQELVENLLHGRDSVVRAILGATKANAKLRIRFRPV